MFKMKMGYLEKKKAHLYIRDPTHHILMHANTDTHDTHTKDSK